MKKFTVLLIVLLTCSLEAQQYYYTFSELRGMEDQGENTNLFYRKYSHWENSSSFEERNNIYRLDLENNIDTIFLSDYSYYYPFLGGSSVRVYDFDFWNNNPSEYIYCFVGSIFLSDDSPITEIQRFDNDGGYMNISGFASAEISEQNDSLVYGTNGYFVKSKDGGRNWEELGTNFGLIALSPFNDSVLFGLGEDGLLKSDNGGNSFFVVDTNKSNWPNYNNIYGDILFDKDSLHIYRFYQNGSSYNLSVSGNEGNAFSWELKYSSFQKIFISIDYSQSGSIYLADGRYIYHSTDFGITFTEYKVLDRRIVGIYKKPSAGGGSNKLYAATKYDLYEITPDTIISIKHLTPDPDLFSWYPLQIGNAWVYNSTFMGDTSAEEYISSKEIIDTILYNNTQYFIVENKTYLAKTFQSLYADYYRIDSSLGKICKAYFIDDSLTFEELYIDLTTEIGDTFYINEFQPVLFESEEPFNQWGINSTKRNYIGQSTPLHDFSLVKEIGLSYEFWWELVGFEHKLKGAVIDGTIFGDITPLGIDREVEKLPKDYHLSQNYPNPFNPTTKIRYSIPNVTLSEVEGSLVILKVYDVLGREVATLVNEEKPAGVYEVEFDASQISSGIYFYKLQTENYTSTKKMIYLK